MFQEKISIFEIIVDAMEKKFLFLCYTYYFTNTFSLVIWCKIIFEENEYTTIEIKASRFKVRSSALFYNSFSMKLYQQLSTI